MPSAQQRTQLCRGSDSRDKRLGDPLRAPRQRVDSSIGMPVLRHNVRPCMHHATSGSADGSCTPQPVERATIEVQMQAGCPDARQQPALQGQWRQIACYAVAYKHTEAIRQCTPPNAVQSEASLARVDRRPSQAWRQADGWTQRSRQGPRVEDEVCRCRGGSGLCQSVPGV
jgi:hypothetical protein